MPDEIKPPDWENPPCPACFAFDVEQVEIQTSAETQVRDLRQAYAAGLAQGFLMCRMRSDTWKFLCPTHLETVQTVIDMVCEDFGLPREKLYADFGVPMPQIKEKN